MILAFALFPYLLLHVLVSAQESFGIPRKEIGRDVNGLPVLLPLIGAGTSHYNDTIVHESLCKAFSSGYKLVDTAYNYGNQEAVGNAIADCYLSTRDKLFVLTKVPGGMNSQETHAAFFQSLFRLNLEYVDSLILHFPGDRNNKDASSKKQRQEQWLALEDLYFSGKARSIGVSHYCPQHIDDILEVANVLPAINQVEYHVGSGDVDGVIRKCTKHGITFMPFSALCGQCKHYNPKDSLVNGELVTDIAQHYGVTGSQVSLRYIVQQALIEGSAMGAVIPRSNNIEHIRSNRDIFSFDLSDADMERLQKATRPAAKDGDCSVP